MWIRKERGGVNQCGQGFLYVLGLFKGSFGLCNAYLVVFGLFFTQNYRKLKKIYI